MTDDPTLRVIRESCAAPWMRDHAEDELARLRAIEAAARDALAILNRPDLWVHRVANADAALRTALAREPGK